jgi:hypothetical protein
MLLRHATLVAIVVLFISVEAGAAPRGNRSTITFGKSESLKSGPAKKRNFKQDIEAVNKAHQSWKKAHLNSVLYECQKNGTETATLARKVADKMESSKAQATKEAQALAKSLAAALNDSEDPGSAPLSASQKAELREKLKKLESAEKKGQILERLAYQVKSYYMNDAPKSSPFGGGCPVSYSTALQRGLEASSRYHADAEALKLKLEALLKRAKTALRKSERPQMVAGR